LERFSGEKALFIPKEEILKNLSITKMPYSRNLVRTGMLNSA